MRTWNDNRLKFHTVEIGVVDFLPDSTKFERKSRTQRQREESRQSKVVEFDHVTVPTTARKNCPACDGTKMCEVFVRQGLFQ